MPLGQWLGLTEWLAREDEGSKLQYNSLVA
jgi:hypothetical protein